MEYSPAVLVELNESFELMVDIMDFAHLAKQTLKDITLIVVDFKVLTTLLYDLITHTAIFINIFFFFPSTGKKTAALPKSQLDADLPRPPCFLHPSDENAGAD